MSWPKILKNSHFEVLSLLILWNNNEPFLNWIVTCNKKWILYDSQWWPAQWLDWEEAPKHFPKPNLQQKKVMVTVWWSAAILIHYRFLNPSQTITSEYAQQIDEMYQKLQRLQTALINRMSPILLHDSDQLHVTNQHFESWMIWAAKVCFILHIHLTSCQKTTTSNILTTFYRENAFTTSRRQKMLSKSSSNLEAQIFMLRR